MQLNLELLRVIKIWIFKGEIILIKVVVNGEDREYRDDITLKSLIEDLKIEDKVMAAALNMEVVKKDAWSITTLKDGDSIELLHFVGGG
jgi:sulfur carrier protein